MDAVKNGYINDYQQNVDGWCLMMDKDENPNLTITHSDLWVHVKFKDITDIFIGSLDDCHITTKCGYVTVPMSVMDVLV